MRSLEFWQATALLDALPDAIAVLDQQGTIIAVNHAWRMFALDNGGPPATTGVGVNYLDVCARSGSAGCEDARAVHDGLVAVLSGETVEVELEYACPSSAVGRWFVLRITPVAGRAAGALVSHVNITRRKEAEGILQRKASQDPLTGLANRALFLERLATAMTPRRGRAQVADVGVLYLDLDRFKPVNDTYGHAAGDEVLQSVARRLIETTRPQDTIARLGGDEFAIVAPRITPTGLAGLVTRIHSALSGVHLIHGCEVQVGVSIGSHLSGPGDDVANALRTADSAMYVAKRGRQADPRHASSDAGRAQPGDAPDRALGLEAEEVTRGRRSS